MAPKPISTWSVDEVAIWLMCIGLGTKIDPFKENAVDGSLLETLTAEDLTGDLGLSNLQAKKMLHELDFTKSITSADRAGNDLSEAMDKLEVENMDLEKQLDEKDARIAELEAQIAKLKAPPEPVAAPAPAPAAPPQSKGHPVVANAARGAAGGAVKGAVAGAILPGMSAADGAKAGAAVGATGGAMRGVGVRRQRRMGR